MTVRALRIIGPHGGTSGYELHVGHFVRQFDRMGIAVELRPLPHSQRRAAGRQRPAGTEFSRHYGLIHVDAVLHFSLPHWAQPQPGMVNILHTMFETNRVLDEWVSLCRRFDMVVVPTESSRMAWVRSGMPSRQIVVSPLGVEVDRFDGSSAPLPLSLSDGRPVTEFQTRFLNVAAAGPRKNPLGLLRAWCRATTPADNAALIMKHGPDRPAPTRWFQRGLADLRPSLRRAAPVLFLNRTLPPDDMPALYCAATHYITLSFGEGWDQPLHEAAASNLRLIAPDHSAYARIIRSDVADVIPSRPVPALFPGEMELQRLFAGAHWWEPDEAIAAAYIRAAIDGTSDQKLSPRAHVLDDTWEHAAESLIRIVDRVVAPRSRGPLASLRRRSTVG